jgi:hypothetical protein
MQKLPDEYRIAQKQPTPVTAVCNILLSRPDCLLSDKSAGRRKRKFVIQRIEP